MLPIGKSSLLPTLLELLLLLLLLLLVVEDYGVLTLTAYNSTVFTPIPKVPVEL